MVAHRKKPKERLEVWQLHDIPVVWVSGGDTFHRSGCHVVKDQSLNLGAFREGSDRLLRPCLTCLPRVATTSNLIRAWTMCVRQSVVRLLMERDGMVIDAIPKRDE